MREPGLHIRARQAVDALRSAISEHQAEAGDALIGVAAPAGEPHRSRPHGGLAGKVDVRLQRWPAHVNLPDVQKVPASVLVLRFEHEAVVTGRQPSRYPEAAEARAGRACMGLAHVRSGEPVEAFKPVPARAERQSPDGMPCGRHVPSRDLQIAGRDLVGDAVDGESTRQRFHEWMINGEANPQQPGEQRIPRLADEGGQLTAEVDDFQVRFRCAELELALQRRLLPHLRPQPRLLFGAPDDLALGGFELGALLEERLLVGGQRLTQLLLAPPSVFVGAPGLVELRGQGLKARARRRHLLFPRAQRPPQIAFGAVACLVGATCLLDLGGESLDIGPRRIELLIAGLMRAARLLDLSGQAVDAGLCRQHLPIAHGERLTQVRFRSVAVLVRSPGGIDLGHQCLDRDEGLPKLVPGGVQPSRQLVRHGPPGQREARGRLGDALHAGLEAAAVSAGRGGKRPVTHERPTLQLAGVPARHARPVMAQRRA